MKITAPRLQFRPDMHKEVSKHPKTSPRRNAHRVAAQHLTPHKKHVAVPVHHERLHPKSSPQTTSHKFVWAWSLIGVLVVSSVILFFLQRHVDEIAKASHKPVAPSVPISTAVAKKGDIGVYVQAIGTVLPISTVTLTSRVQGQIMKVQFNEGQMVHQNDLLFEIDPRPYQAALKEVQGQFARDQAMLKKDQVDLIRYKQAFAKKAIAQQQLDDQIQVVSQDRGNVKTDQGNLENAKLNLTYCRITSPINGRVGLRLVDVGNLVQANSTTGLAVVTQLKPITVVFSVPEDNLVQIQEQVREKQQMTVAVYDRSQEKKLAEGNFMTLDNQVDPTTGTVKIKAIFDNEDGSLFPNQFVNAKLLVSTQKEATLVASQAIQLNNEGAYVYVIKADQTATLRKIKAGTTDGSLTAVTGLNPGENVAISGFDKLKDGTKVSVRKPQAVAEETLSGVQQVSQQ